jgi:hypothetical protein
MNASQIPRRILPRIRWFWYRHVRYLWHYFVRGRGFRRLDREVTIAVGQALGGGPPRENTHVCCAAFCACAVMQGPL